MKKNKENCDLRSCFFCKNCSKEWLGVVDIRRETFDYKKGEMLFDEGEEVKGIYFIYKGKVKVHKKWGDNKEMIVRFAGEGDIVGHRGLGKSNIYPVAATTIEKTSACYIDLGLFESSLKVNFELMYKLLMFYAEELQESEKNMRNLAHMPVKGRIAYALLKLRDRFGLREEGFINISLSRQDLASFAGTTYETTSRVMTELVQEGLLQFDGKEIVILDDKSLGILASGDAIS
jgi:CRP/FNR family transcriptional regulator